MKRKQVHGRALGSSYEMFEGFVKWLLIIPHCRWTSCACLIGKKQSKIKIRNHAKMWNWNWAFRDMKWNRKEERRDWVWRLTVLFAAGKVDAIRHRPRRGHRWKVGGQVACRVVCIFGQSVSILSLTLLSPHALQVWFSLHAASAARRSRRFRKDIEWPRSEKFDSRSLICSQRFLDLVKSTMVAGRSRVEGRTFLTVLYIVVVHAQFYWALLRLWSHHGVKLIDFTP